MTYLIPPHYPDIPLWLALGDDAPPPVPERSTMAHSFTITLPNDKLTSIRQVMLARGMDISNPSGTVSGDMGIILGYTIAPGSAPSTSDLTIDIKSKPFLVSETMIESRVRAMLV